MSRSLGTYTFLPYLRCGMASLIRTTDSASAAQRRTSLHVELSLVGEAEAGADLTRTFVRDVQLYGPGDVVGIDARSIVRLEPRDGCTNVEPNYLAHIEFYDEDFPWRYTPMGADGTLGRLCPWIALVVLAEDEFSALLLPKGQTSDPQKLPFLRFKDPPTLSSLFPPSDEMWAWAHLHVNQGLTASDSQITCADMAVVLPKLNSALQENPDVAYSRLVCPRRLEANTPYHAFLVPAFETGRLAALGYDPTKAPSASHSSWAAYPPGESKEEPTSMPYYYRWFFRTGGAGDFESLVRLLRAKPVDSRVGNREINVRQPGSNVPGIDDPGLHGVLRLGGALQVPRINYSADELAVIDRYENWDQQYPHPFQTDLAKLINLSDDYTAQTVRPANTSALGAKFEELDDPLISPPLYGKWHSLTRRLLRNFDGTRVGTDKNWVHELNLDPRFRVVAGLGTRVVQEGQEKYMDAAWGQVGSILEANRLIRVMQLAKHTAVQWYKRHFVSLLSDDPTRVLSLTAPIHSRVAVGDKTLYYKLSASPMTTAISSVASRRVLRSRGRVRKLLQASTFRPSTLIKQLNSGAISAAPKRTAPAGVPTLGQIITRGRGPAVHPALKGAIALHAGAKSTAVLTTLQKSPDFKLATLGPTVVCLQGATDSVDAVRFKEAIKDAYEMVDASVASVKALAREPVNVPDSASAAIAAINPAMTIRARLMQRMKLPPAISKEIGNEFIEAMAYPVIDEPMYRPLIDLSPECLLPNINLIPPNSITLLETNQRFVEAYMVGLNHEFARELLWREFPTDQRGSCFRQFWDTASAFATAPDQETLREQLRDITELHKWSKASALGTHSRREAADQQTEQPTKDLVLVIRGEILKRYPTAVVYAHRARWLPAGSGAIGHQLEPIEEDIEPPRSKVRTPLYEAKVDPDIYFFGFDLTAEEVKGGTGKPGSQDPGWFFVVKERPGEPRFGLDIDKNPKLNLWSDLSWSDVLSGGEKFIRIDAAPPLKVSDPNSAVAQVQEQYSDDKEVSWSKSMSSADIAYVLFQAPVLIAVHGSEMLLRA